MTTPSGLPIGFDSAEHFLAAIISSSEDAVVTKDLQGTATSWNASAERIFGYTAEEMIGRPITVIIPPDRLEEEPMILRKLREGQRVEHFETKRVRKDGQLIDISLTISPVKNKAGVIVGASKVARDISPQKLAAKALATAAEETLRQSRMKDEFLNTLSHELRTPLQSILGWVQILRGGDLEEGELEQGLEVIDRNGRMQQHIIEDLLDMNRILSGKVRLDVQKVVLGTVLEAALETVRPAAQAKKIRINAVLDPLSKPVSGDATRLQQVFWNLLQNAIKFTPSGGRVEVVLQRVNSHLEVIISDSGMGISPDFLPHVFDRFRQADGSTTRHHGGLGLGLAIVKHLVELHGGTVMAKSRGLDQGSTFAVILPLAAIHDGRAAETTETLKENPDGGAMPTSPGLHDIEILVVDDDEDSRTLIAKTLLKAGASVRTASSVDAALRLIDEIVPDVLVSDIGMPGKNGYQFLETLRARDLDHGGKIPAIALTAYARVEDRVRALCAGFQILLAKPANGAELVATVRSLADQTR